MQRDLTPPFVDDGRIEIVGFRDAWHGLVLLAPNGHGRRLAQVHILIVIPNLARCNDGLSLCRTILSVSCCVCRPTVSGSSFIKVQQTIHT